MRGFFLRYAMPVYPGARAPRVGFGLSAKSRGEALAGAGVNTCPKQDSLGRGALAFTALASKATACSERRARERAS